MIKTVILEDDPLDRAYLKSILEEHCPQVSVICEIDTGDQAKKILPNLSFDLLLADIQLGDMNSFEIIEGLDRNKFKLIFITSHDSFAIKAIKSKAIDYILKPFDGEELRDAIEDATELNSLEMPLNGIHLSDNYQHSITVISDKRTDHIISTQSITLLKCEGNYTNISFVNQSGLEEKILGSYNLGYFEKLLPSHLFVRIHQSYLVNICMIKRINRSQKTVTLSNGNSIEYSRSGFKKICSIFLKKSMPNG